MRRSTPAARDAGIRQVRSTTKWIAAGAAGLVGFFTAMTLPRAKSSAITTNGAATAGSGQTQQGGGQSSGSGLQGPDQAPYSSNQAPVAHSGGS